MRTLFFYYTTVVTETLYQFNLDTSNRKVSYILKGFSQNSRKWYKITKNAYGALQRAIEKLDVPEWLEHSLRGALRHHKAGAQFSQGTGSGKSATKCLSSRLRNLNGQLWARCNKKLTGWGPAVLCTHYNSCLTLMHVCLNGWEGGWGGTTDAKWRGLKWETARQLWRKELEDWSTEVLGERDCRVAQPAHRNRHRSTSKGRFSRGGSSFAKKKLSLPSTFVDTLWRPKKMLIDLSHRGPSVDIAGEHQSRETTTMRRGINRLL